VSVARQPAGRCAPQPGCLLARLQLQLVPYQQLLGRPGRAGRPTRPAGAGRAGAERPRPDVRRLADGLDGRPQRQLSRVDLGRVELGLGPDPELRRDAHAVRCNVPSPLCLVAPPLRSPRCCSPAMRVGRPSRVGRRGWIAEGFRRGGVVTLSWHMRNPVTGGNAWDTTRAVPAILPGGAQHEHYRQWLDRFADYVNGLRAPGLVPVIFRPLHETSGGWF